LGELCGELLIWAKSAKMNSAKFSTFSPAKIFHFALHKNEDLVFTKSLKHEKGD